MNSLACTDHTRTIKGRGPKQTARRRKKLPHNRRSKRIKRVQKDIERVVREHSEGDYIPRGKFADAVGWLKNKLPEHEKALIMNAFSSMKRDGKLVLNHKRKQFVLTP